MNVLFQDMLSKVDEVISDFKLAPLEQKRDLDFEQAANFMDQTLLKPNCTQDDIEDLIDNVLLYPFCSICVPPCWLPFVSERLKEHPINLCSVIAFPHGNQLQKTKLSEARELIRVGATELDMVLNVSALKSASYQVVFNEILKTKRVCQDKVLKVILETAFLNEREIGMACLLAKEAGADFVKTSTGFAPEGATKEAVALMRAFVGDKLGIKASGGIRDRESFLEMIAYGATRIGTSNGLDICDTFR